MTYVKLCIVTTIQSFLCISEYFCRLSHCIGQIAAGSTQSAVSINATSITGHIQRGRSLHLQGLAQVAMRKHWVAQTFRVIWEVKNKMWLKLYFQFLSPVLSVTHWKEKFSFLDIVYSLSMLATCMETHFTDKCKLVLMWWLWMSC